MKVTSPPRLCRRISIVRSVLVFATVGLLLIACGGGGSDGFRSIRKLGRQVGCDVWTSRL